MSLTPRLPVYYTPKQNAASVVSFSPSAGKPRILAEVLRSGAIPVAFVEPQAATLADFHRVHDAGFVERILTCELKNGFGDLSEEVAASLPYSSGSLLSAARAATPDQPTASLTSGFHHAGYRSCHGFCTFNGLMVAAAAVLAEGRFQRVAILDCDQHHGDGTEDILEVQDHLAPLVLHESFGKLFHQASDAAAYLDHILDLGRQWERQPPDLILYQAGADSHVNDPLGGVLTTEEMRERDRRVFQMARSLRIPLVWNLAGGYQRGGITGIDPVINLHLNTFKEACAIYDLLVPEMAYE